VTKNLKQTYKATAAVSGAFTPKKINIHTLKPKGIRAINMPEHRATFRMFALPFDCLLMPLK